MKMLVLLLVSVLGLATLPAQVLAPPDPAAAATAGKQFVTQLAQGDFAGAVARFDDTMKAALPEAKLRDIWQTLQRQAGTFQKQLGATASTMGGYNVVLVTCQFAQTPLDAKVVFDFQGRVAGLFFVPSHPAAKSAPPASYVHTNAFREQRFTVGQGEWQLPGTLTLPTSGSGPWPALVLVHGSGPEDRDETVGAEKPFQDLAWGLASQGIAVLRYEKRTREYSARLKSKNLCHFTVREETIDDALAAVSELRTNSDIDPRRVFVLGHSLGGMVAPRIGQADPHIAGLILLAGTLPGPLEDVMVSQMRYVISLQGQPSDAATAKLAACESAAAQVRQLTATDASPTTPLLGAPPAYWLDLRNHDSLVIAQKLTRPLLILQGGRDYQDTPDGFRHWQTALGTQTNVTFKLYPSLNHLFITGKGKSTPDEYNEPGHVAEPVVTDIATWIGSR